MKAETKQNGSSTDSASSQNNAPAEIAGRQTSRASSTPEESRTPKSRTTANGSPRCTSPAEVFTIANALAAFFASNLTQDQLQTLINMLGLLEAALAAIVTQQQICEGIIVQPEE